MPPEYYRLTRIYDTSPVILRLILLFDLEPSHRRSPVYKLIPVIFFCGKLRLSSRVCVVFLDVVRTLFVFSLRFYLVILELRNFHVAPYNQWFDVIIFAFSLYQLFTSKVSKGKERGNFGTCIKAIGSHLVHLLYAPTKNVKYRPRKYQDKV